MIITEIYNGSGLGNQLWNIVAPRCIAEHRGFRWGVRRDITNSAKGTPNTSTIGLKTFKGCNFLPNIDFGDEVVGGVTNIEGQEPLELPQGIDYYAREREDPHPFNNLDSMFYDDLLWNTIPDNTKVDGTFQRLRYINDRKSDIIEWLKPSITVTDYSKEDFCVIQFRGGEYLVTASWCPPEYYRMAADRMLEINPNMKFGVVTDDPENAKKFIPWAPIIGASSMDTKDPLVHLQGTGFFEYKGGPIGIDYSILNNAVHSIITSSTFSFWPAWTNTKAKNIIAPKYWFDYKTSNGFWRGDDNIVDEWLYIDTSGVIMNGVDCKEEYREYRKKHSFYDDKPIVT